MILRGAIEANLQALDIRYNKASTPKDALYAAKLALIEVGGWTEESMDDIVLRCSVRCRLEKKHQDYCQQYIVGQVHGFEYEKHFRQMLIKLLGLVNVVRIEKNVDSSKFAILKSSLGTLKSLRDPQAHTYLRGLTRAVNAPSVTIKNFRHIHVGLVEFDRVIRASRW